MAEKNNNIPLIQGIDIMELVAKLWKNRSMIIKWCVVGAVIGLVVGFSLPRVYRSHVSLAPEIEQRIGSGVSSIASMMGVSLDNSIDAISVDMFPSVVSSTPFVFSLFDLQVETIKGEKFTLLEYMKNHQKSPWWNHVLNAPFKLLSMIKDLFTKDEADETEMTSELNIKNLPPRERSVVRYFAKNLIVMIDKKTGKMDFSIEMQDPLVAATVLEAVVENIKEYMVDYRTAKEKEYTKNLEVICASRKAEYYNTQQVYADFLDSNKNISNSRILAERERLQQEMNLAYQVYSQVATQLEAARIKELQSKPVFVVIEPVTIPRFSAGPGKLSLMILFTMLAGFVAVSWVLFGKDLFRKFKNNL